MSYLSYEEYQTMGGTLDETTFSDFAFQAQAQIDWYTFTRLQDEPEQCEAVKRCMYALIKLLYARQQAMALGNTGDESANQVAVASQSNDGVSISYNVMSASEVSKASKAQIKETILQYLQGVKNSLGQRVLYRGLYRGE
jgi:hypothetical protein